MAKTNIESTDSKNTVTPRCVRCVTASKAKPKINHRVLKLERSENVYDENLKRTISRRSFVECDRQAEMSVYRTTDFTIESMQALGTDLSHTVLTPSPINYVDTVADRLSSIE